MINALSICALVATMWNVPSPTEDRLRTCARVINEAQLAFVDIDYAVALTYTESRFSKTARSKAGAVGPFQILPKYHCPGGREKGCDLFHYGMEALIKYSRKHRGNWPEVLCHWNSGNVCNRRSRAFARTVIRRAKELKWKRRQAEASP